MYFGPGAALKAVEVFECKGAGDLPGSVAAEVEEDDAVPIFYGGFARAVGDGDGFDEFVGFAAVVGVLYGCDGVGFCDAFALCEEVIGYLGAFPTVVAVHGVIPPGYGCDAANAMGFEHGEEFAHAVDCALGRCVASVCEGVDEEAFWREAARGCHFDEALVVTGPGVDAAVRDEADEVEVAVVVFDAVYGGNESFVFVQAAVSHAVVYLGHGLHDGASCAQVEVPDFGVAHQAIG